METRYILIADAGRARLLSMNEESDQPQLVLALQSPQGRLHVNQLVEDSRGRVEKRCGSVRSAMDAPSDPHEQEAAEFARGLADIVNEAAIAGKFHELVLVAPAHFLGLLRHGLRPEAAERLILDLPRDLTRLSPARIANYLADHTGLRPVGCDD